MKKTFVLLLLPLTFNFTYQQANACWGFCGDGFRVLPENSDVQEAAKRIEDAAKDIVTLGKHGQDRNQARQENIRAEERRRAEAEQQQQRNQYDMDKLERNTRYLNELISIQSTNNDISDRLFKIKNNYLSSISTYSEAISNLERLKTLTQSQNELLNSIKQDSQDLDEHLNTSYDRESNYTINSDQIDVYNLMVRKSRRYNMTVAKYVSLVIAQLSNNSESKYFNIQRQVLNEISDTIHLVHRLNRKLEQSIQQLTYSCMELKNKIYGYNYDMDLPPLGPPGAPPAQNYP